METVASFATLQRENAGYPVSRVRVRRVRRAT